MVLNYTLVRCPWLTHQNGEAGSLSKQLTSSDVWGTRLVIPYRWRVTTWIWVMLLIGRALREIRLNQTLALPRSGQWHVTGMEFLQSFLRLYFRGETLEASRDVGCFLWSSKNGGLQTRLAHLYFSIQLFRERLSEKSTRQSRQVLWVVWVPFSSKKFGRIAGETMDICLRVLKESSRSRFDSYSVRKSVLIISHRDCREHLFF